MENAFPGKTWQQTSPEEAGFFSDKLDEVGKELANSASGSNYHIAVARKGKLVREWSQGIDPDAHQRQASAAKSYYSSMLGIAVADGKLPSPDAKVVDAYPEMMDVSEGFGPKDGRYAFEKDREITFRQLICNCSGYMKPGENPGKVFHYQTYGMNLLTHALASLYEMYDTNDPERLPGCGQLIEDKIRNPIDGAWSYSYSNFELQPRANLNIFGYYTQIGSTVWDLLRVGTLWMNDGNWNGVQVIPEAYLKEATVTNPFILENEPEENWKYGHGFWVNDHGKQWPNCPRDSFAASGAGAKHTWVCPRLGIGIAQNPGQWDQFKQDEKKKVGSQGDIIARILDAML